MKKLFAAVRASHPDYEILDAQFLVNPFDLDPSGRDVNELDDALAGAISGAGEPVCVPPKERG
jgi:hypothetical protein